MGFASSYLEERVLFPPLIPEAPDNNTGIIVVVPAYNEPGILNLLDSLILCSKPDCAIEVLIIINAPPEAPEEHTENNLIALQEIKSWKEEHSSSFFRLFPIYIDKQTHRDWGVGLARKTGMDEAVRRFDVINNQDGIILNLDADCLVRENYFVSVYEELGKRKDKTACSLYFEHPIEGDDFPDNIFSYAILYELHLRYYFQGLLLSGFPYVFHTVGSALAVKALIYTKYGGMNRRQAGEDFYFIQKLVPSGGYFTLNSTTVYPSPRASYRVPFGTGASIGKMKESNSLAFNTYNILAFRELGSLFGRLDELYQCNAIELKKVYKLLPQGLIHFISEEEWVSKIKEIRNNTSGIHSFKKRFFSWFNMFKIVKYLNFVHIEIFEKKAVEVSAIELLEEKGLIFESKEPVELLLYFREMERNYDGVVCKPLV